MAVLKSEAITAECNNCKYYREYGSDVNVFTPGSCRHELPNGIKLKDGRLEFFPSVLSTDWCRFHEFIFDVIDDTNLRTSERDLVQYFDPEHK